MRTWRGELRALMLAALSGLFVFCCLALPMQASAQSATYTYDSLGRLKQAQYSNGAAISYTLDAAGNRTQVTSGWPAPGAPGVPGVQAITTTSATVSWTAASGTVTSYAYSLNAGPWTSVGTALTVNLTSLIPATSYTVMRSLDNFLGN